MRLEWIEDLLAVMETGSLSRAAEKRFSTQPAFSRRIRSIEEHIGVELLDRTRKPVQIKTSLLDQRQRMQELAAGLRQLTLDLKRQDRTAQNRVVIASQHAITTAMAPHLINRLSDRQDLSIRLRSANRKECLILLMTRQADIILIYESEGDRLAADEDFLERCAVGRERLVPVYATNRLTQLNEAYALGELPVIAYPPDVFLGSLLEAKVFPRLPARSFIQRKAETALTPAALQLAVAGVGIAWVPRSLALGEIGRGSLTELAGSLPSSELFMTALRLTTPKSAAEERMWATVAALSQDETARDLPTGAVPTAPFADPMEA
ncbi:LysR family transcriptional regulator [Algihabitans albus]|uniref:LysR family transcriptional regulator n=1 Tax=Algihabitans albus TaxID=2164067 RepID=UPI000E5CB306|nr:LysR family transcriptional regulator [Algihabitans albus]